MNGYSHVGTGGQGSFLQLTSCGSHCCPRGHWTPSHGSRHLHTGQPLLKSRANPAGQNIRQLDAWQLVSIEVQFTSLPLVRRLPASSTPYSSTHQHSVPFSSFEHWTGSKSPSAVQRGIRTECSKLSPSDLARRDSARRRC